MSISLPSQLVRTRRFTLGIPDQFTVTPDGATVLFLRTRGGDDPVTCLWALDVETGTERLLADPAELLSGPAHPTSGHERSGEPPTRLGDGIGAYATDRAVRLVAFALDGGLWTVDLPGRQVRRLLAEGKAVDPRPDPTGRLVAYVRDGALRVINTDGTEDRVLAAPEGSLITFGTLADAQSLGGPRGYWWAPDGDQLLVARVDSRAVERWHITDPADPGTVPRSVPYASVGKANADVTLWIMGLDGDRVEAGWDHRAFEYLVDAGWDAHGPYAVIQSRDQRTVRLLGIGPGGETRLLLEQRDDCWVQLIPGLPARSADGAVLAHIDRQGTRHLSVDGVTVTPPGVQVRAVLDVDIDSDEVIFTASEEPTEIHLWSYRPGDGARRLSGEPGVHSGLRRGGSLVHVARRADLPGGHFTVEREGTRPVPIASLTERPVLDLCAKPLVLGSRKLRGMLHLPSWRRAGDERLPVLLDPYGGAGLQRVTAELDWRQLVAQWFAEQGFAVLVVDGSGTPGRGPDWEREVAGDLFGPVLDDQVAALHEAARLHPELDLARVGIRGWSFSGSLAVLAVLRRPEIFQVAVAGAGVTDQLLYNAHWRERFLGHPDDFPERYEASSLLREAPNLIRPLLLLHGLADDNVYPANTLRLSSALQAAGRAHELLLLPGADHRPIGGPVTEQLMWHQVRFLQRHLGVSPRDDTSGRPSA